MKLLLCLFECFQAEAYFKRAIAIREEVLGENNTRMASSLQQLAYLYTALGRYNDASELYTRALAILQACLDSSHPDITDVLNKLAWLHLKCGMVKQSDDIYKKLSEDSENSLGKEPPSIVRTLWELSELYQALGTLLLCLMISCNCSHSSVQENMIKLRI